MRVLMLLLILANLGFLGWSVWIAPADNGLPPGRSNEEMGVGLQLAGEDEPVVASVEPAAEPEPEPAADETATATEPDSAAADSVAATESAGEPAEQAVDLQAAAAAASGDYRCVELGPFDQLDVAEVARQRLIDKGYQARLRESGGQIRSGFWVFIPPLDTRDAAKDIEAQLRQKGVRDLFIVTGSENRNAISLGLFSTPDRADQRAAEIGRMGFEPQIAERFRDATVYWLDYRESADDRLEPQSIGVLGADELIPEKRSRDCGPADFDSAGSDGGAIASDRTEA